MKNVERKRVKQVGKKGSRTLLMGLLAGSVLAGAGNHQVFADELSDKDKDNLEEVDGAEVDVAKLMEEARKGKEKEFNLLTQKDGVPVLTQEFKKKVEKSLKVEEVKEEDTATVKRVKEEQESIANLIRSKYDEAKSLGGVVQGVRGENLGSGTITKQVALSEGEDRLQTITEELESLVAVKGILDQDLEDAKQIEDEIARMEASIRLELEGLFGDSINGELRMGEDGELSVTGDYVEYLNVIESEQGSLNVRSSFVEQTTKGSKVLASYYGKDKALDSVIGEGFKYLSMPYVWGGESVAEGGFDCSGLMQRIFKDTLGVELPRVARDQQNFGEPIPLEDIKPGDLVFWNTPATHVALYLGDGKIMEAANPQAGLRVRDVRLSELSSARRVYDFNVSEKDAIIHITNAKRTVSYTPDLNREQSEAYNNVDRQSTNSPTRAEIDAKVKAIEKRAREDKARLDSQKQQESSKQGQKESVKEGKKDSGKKDSGKVEEVKKPDSKESTKVKDKVKDKVEEDKKSDSKDKAELDKGKEESAPEKPVKDSESGKDAEDVEETTEQEKGSDKPVNGEEEPKEASDNLDNGSGEVEEPSEPVNDTASEKQSADTNYSSEEDSKSKGSEPEVGESVDENKDVKESTEDETVGSEKGQDSDTKE